MLIYRGIEVVLLKGFGMCFLETNRDKYETEIRSNKQNNNNK